MRRALCLLLLLVAFSACGTQATTLNDAGDSTTPVTVSAGGATPRSNAPTASAGQSAPIHIDCGEIAMLGNPARVLDDAETVRAASACFVQASASCTPAVLTIRERDTKIVRQFIVESGVKCLVRQALQPDPNSPPALADCESVRAEKNGLVISACSHLGDFVLSP